MGLRAGRMRHLATRVGMSAAAATAVLALAVVATDVLAQSQKGESAPAGKEAAAAAGQGQARPVDQRSQGVPRLHAPESHEPEDDLPDRHGRTRRQDLGIEVQLDARRLSAGERPPVPHRGARRRGTGVRRRAGLGRADPGVRLGRRARLGFRVPQRQAVSPPRRRQDAQRQRADGRLGQEDHGRGDRRRAEAGAGEQLRAARLDRGDQADGQDDRRGRLGMAPLGPPRAGSGLDQGELRRRGRASRAGRHQLRREPDGPRSRRARSRSPRRPVRPGTRRRTRSRRPRPRSSRRSATSARPRSGRSGSTRTGPTSMRSTTTPSSTRS